MYDRRNPFEMFNEMDRMFDQMRRSMFGGSDRPAIEGSSELPEAPRLGAADSNLSLERSDDGFVVLADLPGFETDEFDLRYDDGFLYIRASHEVQGEGFSRSRNVRESVRIPGDVVAEEISASYRNGVLEIHLPVAESDEGGHHIEIE